MTIRVLIADDQAVVRAGLRTIVEIQDDLQVVGEAENGSEAIESVRVLSPDVVLMDIRMPQLDGIEATRRLVAGGAQARVLMLTTYGHDDYVFEALKAGAAGFLLKTESPERIVDAVRVVASGDALLAPEITRRLIDRYLTTTPPAAPPMIDELTPRELEVLRHVARGLSNAEIAKSLYVGEGTVKTHVGHILAKLELRDRVQAVVFAYETGLVNRGGSAA